MGFLTDIAEIAGLLFVAYMAGWLVGYLAHRLTARAPQLETTAATREPAVAQAPASDALVRAPVVVPVAATPPPQVLAAATAIEPVRATAVPDADEPAPQPEPDPPPAPAVSALDTLKSLSTAMPLLPTAETAEALPAASDEIVPSSIAVPPAAPEGIEPAASPEIVEPATPAEPVVAAAPMEPAAPAGAEAAEPTLVIPPAVVEDREEIAAPARPKIRIAPATRAGEIAAPSMETPLPAAAEPIPVALPMPASAPGVPWVGAIKGHAAQKFASEAGLEVAKVAAAPDSAEPIEEPDAALDVALLSSIADQLKLGPAAPAADDGDAAAAAAEPPTPPAPAQPEVVATEPPLPLTPPPQAEPIAPPPSASAEPPPLPPRRPALEEDAAMRAIEGGWSRRDVRALGDAPEMTDVSAAVSAAQVAVEQVLARNGVDAAEPEARAQASFGKPAGLPQPRDGRRDSLKRIDGLGPLDEVTLNNLGIYHFDQIAKWTEREVLWLENHAFAVGRIAREDWQDQARELIAERDATRALR